MRRVAISVIVASDRAGADLNGCLDSLARQAGAPDFEVIVVSAQPPPAREDLLMGWVRMQERNPAARRNRAAAFSAGEALAFLDDDAVASPDWLARGFPLMASHGIVGGRDLAPEDSPYPERISDLLLATPFLGSAVAAHERSPRPGPVSRPWALTLCNLFVRRELFDALEGFDETLGYIGEDTDFLRRAMAKRSRPQMVPGLVVFHRRRAFPFAFLRQRWRYRFKTGRLLSLRPGVYPRGKIAAFLLGGAALGTAAAILGPAFLLPAAAAYAGLVWALSARLWARDPALLPIVPIAFAIHHFTYWLATLSGGIAGAFESPGKPAGLAGRRGPEERVAMKESR